MYQGSSGRRSKHSDAHASSVEKFESAERFLQDQLECFYLGKLETSMKDNETENDYDFQDVGNSSDLSRDSLSVRVPKRSQMSFDPITHQ
jgi:hypothetical protein